MMPGWDSISTVAAVHSGFTLAGLVLLAMLTAFGGFMAWQFRSRWPEWLDLGDYQLRSRFVVLGVGAVLGALLVSQVVAYGYGLRQNRLMAEAELSSTNRIAELAAEAKRKPPVESSNRYIRENSDLRRRLDEAEVKIAALEKTQIEKRLSDDQRRLMIETLRPFAGQKVSIASIRGDDEGKVLARDFVSVFDAAGWDHHGDDGVTTQDWPRDPVGIEIALNEDDARADHIPDGVAALINVVRKLGLVYDNTVYMDNDVPPGQALLKVGKKLRN